MQGDDGVVYQLPDAEYITEVEANISEVHAEVLTIASSVNIDPYILVSEAASLLWTLPRAQ